jgi:hypothetical protein
MRYFLNVGYERTRIMRQKMAMRRNMRFRDVGRGRDN